jgi:hypothetical protein
MQFLSKVNLYSQNWTLRRINAGKVEKSGSLNGVAGRIARQIKPDIEAELIKPPAIQIGPDPIAHGRSIDQFVELGGALE